MLMKMIYHNISMKLWFICNYSGVLFFWFEILRVLRIYTWALCSSFLRYLYENNKRTHNMLCNSWKCLHNSFYGLLWINKWKEINMQWIQCLRSVHFYPTHLYRRKGYRKSWKRVCEQFKIFQLENVKYCFGKETNIFTLMKNIGLLKYFILFN